MITAPFRSSQADRTRLTMHPRFSKWILPALALAYLLAANLAFARGSPALAAAAFAILIALIAISIRGERRVILRVIVGAVGLLLALGVAFGKVPPVPLLLPPVLIPAALAWVFGHTLMPGQTPLIERFARAFHAPDGLASGVVVYTRRVTWCWTLLLAAMALGNLVLASNVSPGGLIEAAGFHAPWPVSPSLFGWVSNLASYLLIGGMFIAEFVVRLIRFPGYRFRNPVEFVRRARTRMPAMIESFRE